MAAVRKKLKMSNPSIPPPTNNLVTPLLTDLYQITMGYAYWKSKKHEEESVFELFFRKNPFKGSFTIFCGIDEVMKFIQHFKITESDIAYLKSTPALCDCEEDFFEYLANLDCSKVHVQSLQQGSIAFPREPLIIVKGPLLICQLIETTLLNLVNFPSLVATNAARLVIAARGQHGDILVNKRVPKCVEYGLRRAQGPDGGLSASKYCIVGGFDATANVLAGKLFDLPILGTHAHAFVQSHSSLDEVKNLLINTSEGPEKELELLNLVLNHKNQLAEKFGNNWVKTNDGELAAFIAYAVAFPNGFLSLVDTYHTLNSGIKNFLLVALAIHDCGYTPVGIRLDSGDLGSLSLQCQSFFEDMAEKLNRPFLKDLSIVASDSINEKKLLQLNANGHAITAFGIGTHLVTCQAQPALGCVFKLVELNGTPRIKFSNDPFKVLIPGLKRSFRFFDEKGTPQMDLLIHSDESPPQNGVELTCFEPYKDDPVTIIPSRVEEILHTVWNKNKGAEVPILSLKEAKESVEKEIKSMNPEMLRIENPVKYNVYLSTKLNQDLFELQKKLQASLI